MVTETDKFGSHFGIANRVIFWKDFTFLGVSFLLFQTMKSGLTTYLPALIVCDCLPWALDE